MLLIKKIKKFLLMITTSLFPAFSFSVESEKGGCDDKFYKTDKVFGKNYGLTVYNDSGQDLVIRSLSFDKNDLLNDDFKILGNKKTVYMCTTPPSKNSISFFNQFTFSGKNDANDKLVVRIEVDRNSVKDRSFYTEGSLEVSSSYVKNNHNLVVHLNRVY